MPFVRDGNLDVERPVSGFDELVRLLVTEVGG
jgi:hypothetical protein